MNWNLDAALGMDAISSPIELFTGMAFLIFISVMLVSFIVSATVCRDGGEILESGHYYFIFADISYTSKCG